MKNIILDYGFCIFTLSIKNMLSIYKKTPIQVLVFSDTVRRIVQYEKE